MQDTANGPRVPVLYTSEHGPTRAIAERIAVRLRHNHIDASAQSITATSDVDPRVRDAFVIGSAVYYRSWLRSAQSFVERHRDALARRPVWLFSSGSLGRASTPTDADPTPDDTQQSPVQRLTSLLAPREHHIFSGMVKPASLASAARAVRSLPSARDLLPGGDGRDWAEIDAWADHIAHELARLRLSAPDATDAMPI